MRKRFAITKVDASGLRVLATPAQGRCLSDTREEAEAKLKAILNTETNSASVLASVYGDVSKMRVQEVNCFTHGDPCSTVFGYDALHQSVADSRELLKKAN